MLDRRLLSVLLACATPLSACDSNGTSVTAGAGDAAADGALDGPLPLDGSPRDGGTDAGGDVAVGDSTLYAGQAATLSATTTVVSPAYVWTVTSAPAGSAVTTSALTGAATGHVSFTSDVVGDYVLAVRVTGAGGAIATTTATVHAVAAYLFYARAGIGTSGGEVGLYAIGHDGSDEHAVACAVSFQASEANAYESRTLFAAATTMDEWEAPAMQADRFVFSGTQSLTKDDAGDYQTFLIAGTTRNSCNSASTTLRMIAGPAGSLGQPRFSPDGSRVAFLEPVGASFGVATVAFDASGYRSIAPIYATPPASGDESTTIRVEWQDASHLAWPRPLGNGSWQLVVASDAAGATPAPYVTCPGATTPHHVALLADGSVVASYAPAANTATDILVVKPDSTGGCQVVHNLTQLPGGTSSRAHDAAVSPDGKWVAYLHYDATQNGGAASSSNEGLLYRVPVDGSAAPVAVGATPMLGRIGPRWIAGGAWLAWTRAGTPADGGDPHLADNAAVVRADGSGAKDLAKGDGVSVIVGAVGPGGSCGIGGATDAPAGIVAAVLALLLARRRQGATI